MHKLVVLFALCAVAAAKPSVGHLPLVQTYAAAPAVIASPSAVSHQSRVDVVSKQVVAAPVVSYSAPVVETVAPVVYSAPSAVSHQSRVDVVSKQVAVAPVVSYAAPVVNTVEVAPAPVVYTAPASAVSHQSRVDIKSAPVVASYAAPVVSSYAAPAVAAYAAPAISAYSAPVVSSYAAPLALTPYAHTSFLHANGVPVDTAEVAAAKIAHIEAKGHYIHKRSAVLPIAYSAVVAPSAVSHQSRVDVVSKQVAVAPVVSYAAPVVSHYSAPVVSAYSAPVVSAYSAYSAPVVSAYSTPLVSAYGAKAYSVHPY